jgi:hypothetical protein
MTVAQTRIIETQQRTIQQLHRELSKMKTENKVLEIVQEINASGKFHAFYSISGHISGIYVHVNKVDHKYSLSSNDAPLIWLDAYYDEGRPECLGVESLLQKLQDWWQLNK